MAVSLCYSAEIIGQLIDYSGNININDNNLVMIPYNFVLISNDLTYLSSKDSKWQ